MPKKEDNEENLSLNEMLRRQIEEIKAAEANALRAGEFQKKFSEDEKKKRKGAKEVHPWDLPDSELWIDGVAPPSFVEFVEGKDFMRGVLFPRQRDAIVNSVGNLAREVFYPRLDLEEYEARRKKGDDVTKERITSVVTLLWGKGSGKDFLIAYLIAWLVYVVNSLNDPWAYFTHEYGEPIEAINVARNADQAKEVFFNKLGNNLHKDCFKKFPYEEKSDAIIFKRDLPGFTEPVELLSLYSRHSQSGSYEGHNILFFVMDEASAFELKGAAQNKNMTRTTEAGDDIILSPADEIYNTLKTSAGTRFGSQWLGFIISFPRVEGDFTMRMYNNSQEGKENNIDQGDAPYPYLWGDTGATWEINTRTKKEHFAADYRDDPETAKLMLECIPPPARGGFFSIPERIDTSFSEEHEPAILYTEKISFSLDGQKLIALHIDRMNLSPNHTYYGHFDPGLSGDSFAFALAHPNWLLQEQVIDPDGKEYSVPQIVIDAILEWRPNRREKISVDFLNVNEVIMKIAHKCKLDYCTADIWNSEHLKQSLQKARVHVAFEGINSKDQLAAYKNLKMVMYRGLLRICGPYEKDQGFPANERARDELRRLQLINGTKVDHPPGGSKDIADAIAGASYLCSQKGLQTPLFSDWNMKKKNDILTIGNDNALKNASKVFAAPTWKQVVQGMRGIM